jgi:hypothetical protein
MAVAESRRWRAMLEEGKARRVAGERGIHTMQTIDVLILAVIMQVMDGNEAMEAREDLARMIAELPGRYDVGGEG